MLLITCLGKLKVLLLEASMETKKGLDIKSRHKSLICKTRRGDQCPKGCVSEKSPPLDLRSVFGMVLKEAARGGKSRGSSASHSSAL